MADDDCLPADTGDNHLLIVLRRDLKVNKEVVEHLSHLLRLVLVDHMAHLIKNDKLELALHLSDSKVLVHSVRARQQQLLGHANIQEALGETLEPSFPVGFSGEQVSAPHILSCTSLLISFADDLRRHGNACALEIFHSATLDAVLHNALQALKLGGA